MEGDIIKMTVNYRKEGNKEGDILKAEIIKYIAQTPLKYCNLHNMAYDIADYVHKPKE